MHDNEERHRLKSSKTGQDIRDAVPDIDDADLHGGETTRAKTRTKDRWDAVHNVPATDEGTSEE